MAKLLDDCSDLVVECFAKLTERSAKEPRFFIQSSSAKTILKAGLQSNSPKTKARAEQARENLLKAGHFEFLDLEDDESD